MRCEMHHYVQTNKNSPLCNIRVRAVETRPDLARHAPAMRSYLERYGER